MSSLSKAVSLAQSRMEFERKREIYRHDIALWAKDNLGIVLWSKQKEIAKALVEQKKVAVKSCHGSGKSFFASIVIAWWVDTRHNVEAVAVSTAPTYEQVNKILWRYLRQHAAKNDLIGEVNQSDEWKIGKETVAWGRKPADTNLHGFQGVHSAGGVLAVIDEACGVPEALFTGVETITTGVNDRILAIANPDDVNTPFGRIFTKNDPSWYKITITAFDTPNFTDERLTMPKAALEGLLDPKWVEEKRISWGENDPRWIAKILAEFSTEATNNLFSLATLLKGTSADITPGRDTKPVLGVDVARFGSDLSVVYKYHDGVATFVDRWAKTDTVDSTNRIHRHAIAEGVAEVRVDAVGLGAGVYDQLIRKADGQYEVIGMIGNGPTPDAYQWLNARAFWFDDVRERMHKQEIQIEPDDEQRGIILQEELGSILFHFKNQRKVLQIESKEDMAQRGLKSPDYADAFIYACADLKLNPKDPINQYGVGEEFDMSLEDIFGGIISISPM